MSESNSPNRIRFGLIELMAGVAFCAVVLAFPLELLVIACIVAAQAIVLGAIVLAERRVK